VTDIAAQAVLDLQQEMLDSVSDDFDPETEETKDVKYERYRLTHTKLKPEWRPEDKSAVEQLKSAAELVVNDIFGASFAILDELYSSVRVPVLTKYETPALDAKNRIIWQRDESGEYLEDWRKLDGYDIERALVRLQNLRLETSQRVQELFLETLMAKYSLQDEWHAAYEAPVQGTNPQREAVANRRAKNDRYNYLFRFWIYSNASVFEREIKDTSRLLERIRQWRVTESNRWE